MRVSTLALAALLAACGEPSGPGTPVGEPFTLAIGDATTVAATGLTIRFVSVVEDSRCPSRAECVWAGDGAVAVETTGGTEARRDTLHTNFDPRFVTIDGWGLEFTALEPYPEVPEGIPPGAYRATFILGRTR